MTTADGIDVAPMSERDHAAGYTLACDLEPAWPRLSGDRPLVPPEFDRRVWSRVFAQFVATDAERGFLGVCSLYDVSERHGVAWADAMVRPGLHDGDDIERRMFDHVIDRALVTCGWRRVFVATVEWRPPCIGSRWAVTRQGALTEHLYHQGRRWDIVIDAVAPAAP